MCANELLMLLSQDGWTAVMREVACSWSPVHVTGCVRATSDVH